MSLVYVLPRRAMNNSGKTSCTLYFNFLQSGNHGSIKVKETVSGKYYTTMEINNSWNISSWGLITASIMVTAADVGQPGVCWCWHSEKCDEYHEQYKWSPPVNNRLILYLPSVKCMNFKYEPFPSIVVSIVKYSINNQLEKLEAAKAAWLVYLSSLSLTGSFLVFLGKFLLTLPGLTWPYLA